MALSMLAEMGLGGVVLLIVLAVLVISALGAVVLWADYLLRPHGVHVARAGLDIASPVPSPTGSMQLDQDTEAWQARQWEHEFRAHHSAEEVFAAADQEGGWTSGACTNTDPGGDDPSWALGPPPAPGPGVSSPSPRPGHPDVPPEGPWVDGLIADIVDPPPELAHEEYAGPAPDPLWPPVEPSEVWLARVQAEAAPGWTYAGGIAA